MKKSEEVAEQLSTATLDMFGMLKNMRLPNPRLTADEYAEACVAFAQEMYKFSNMCQDIAWTAQTLRNTIVEEQWNTVLDDMADEMGVK